MVQASQDPHLSIREMSYSSVAQHLDLSCEQRIGDTNNFPSDVETGKKSVDNPHQSFEFYPGDSDNFSLVNRGNRDEFPIRFERFHYSIKGPMVVTLEVSALSEWRLSK